MLGHFWSSLNVTRSYRLISQEFIAKVLNQRVSSSGLLLLLVFLISIPVSSQSPSPKDVLGFEPGKEHTIADWNQITQYFHKLDAASEKVTVREIGKTTLGKSQIAAFISSEKNIKNLESIRKQNVEIANARTETSMLADKAKSVVAISCSIHSTEIVASQMSMTLAYELATNDSEITRTILDNTVLILIPSANPDGIDIVADWYRKTLGTKYEGSSPPELYHHYAGHDNNRDWFMMNLAETRNITKLFWQDWFPHIVYDVHQQGSTGPRMTIPPFFDPPNPRIPASLLREIGLAGYKMAADMSQAGETGVATNATYDTWWHGGFRSAPYYHNSVGILSEAASARLMTPVEIKKEQLAKRGPTRGLKNPLETSTNFPEAWMGGTWGPSDITRLELNASWSLLELAAKFKDRYIGGVWRLAKDNKKRKSEEPYAFIVPAGQPHGERVSRFLEILMWQGIEVHLMKNEIEAASNNNERDIFEEVPAGSFIVLVNQAQKNNILSLFEKQVYPDRINAAGEAEVPYDVSGWTLPLQMGVEYQEAWEVYAPDKISSNYERMSSINQVRKMLNLPKSRKPFDKLPNPLKSSPKIGLYKGSGSSMDEGWTRLVLDNHQIAYSSVQDREIREGKLNFDSIILPSQSENQIVKGLSADRYPTEYTGGITEAGVDNLKEFVETGGTLICFDDSCEMVINRFGLPMKNTLKGLNRKQFHCPGTILEIDLDMTSRLAKGMKQKTPAYFIYSSAYEIEDTDRVKSVAKYGSKDILLSGWIYGEKHINGKTAIAESTYGKGKIVLFGFRPQHRGQTYGTFPLIFNALEK